MEETKLFNHNQYAQHAQAPLERATLLTQDPIAQFQRWFDAARAPSSGVSEPEAMCLSTVDPVTHIPSSRMVLLKQVDPRGFCFYTNYTSRKGHELFGDDLDATKPTARYASLCFYWKEMERSVRVVGKVERMSREETTTYFHSRPLESQLGAWISDQSRPLASRDILHTQLETKKREMTETERRTGKLPAPPFWGGVRIIPHEMEFWQGQPNRLHDRFQYRLRSFFSDAAGTEQPVMTKTNITSDDEAQAPPKWICERLSP